ncbi:MAG: helix-turn-helix domain-containing protein [Burkholderiales bacterium]|nr:helix-turn-helix domain-containing protein [Burkholderiales bacterium]
MTISTPNRPQLPASLDAHGILDRAKQVAGVKSDAELSRLFGKEHNSVANWRKRSTVPITELVAFARAHGASIDWLLTNEGSPRASTNRVDETIFSAVCGALSSVVEQNGLRLSLHEFAPDAISLFGFGVSAAYLYNLVFESPDEESLRKAAMKEAERLIALRRRAIGRRQPGDVSFDPSESAAPRKKGGRKGGK